MENIIEALYLNLPRPQAADSPEQEEAKREDGGLTLHRRPLRALFQAAGDQNRMAAKQPAVS